MISIALGCLFLIFSFISLIYCPTLLVILAIINIFWACMFPETSLFPESYKTLLDQGPWHGTVIGMIFWPCVIIIQWVYAYLKKDLFDWQKK